jgi:hypothetical protein
VSAPLTAALLLALPVGHALDPARLPDAEVLRRAEEAFRQGAAERANPDRARRRFARAADLYELLRRRGADNADLYRNQGRAHLLAGRLPDALLAYRRGLRSAPHDADLRDDLAYARGQVQYLGPERHGRPTAEPWPWWMPRVAPGLLLIAALTLYALAWFCGTRGVTGGRPWLLSWAAGLLAVAVVVGGLWTFLAWQASRGDRYPVVVVAEEGVPLRRGNGPTYPAHPQAPQLHLGMEASLLHRRGGWLQVRLPGGEVGWLPAGAALVEE